MEFYQGEPWTAVKWAVAGEPLSTIEILLGRQAGRLCELGTVLHVAVAQITPANKSIETVSMLLRHGAQINGKDAS